MVENILTNKCFAAKRIKKKHLQNFSCLFFGYIWPFFAPNCIFRLFWAKLAKFDYNMYTKVIENILTNNCFCCRNNKNLFRSFSVNLVLIVCPFGPQNWLLGLFDQKWLNLTIKCAPKWLTIHSLIKAFAAKRIKSVSEIFQSISGLFWVHFGPKIGFLGLWPPFFTLLFRHT